MGNKEQESWFEEMLRCNSRFLDIKMELPKNNTRNSEEIAVILLYNNPQTQLDEMIQSQKADISAEMANILAKNNPQTKLDEMVEQVRDNLNFQNIVITPYMRTQQYQIFRSYWLGLPNYIQQTIACGGEILLSGIGNPDPALLETFVQYAQFYLNSFYSELGLEATVIAPEYQNQGYDKKSVIKMVGDYRLSVKPKVKMQEGSGKNR